jgi:hypothetical protein
MVPIATVGPTQGGLSPGLTGFRNGTTAHASKPRFRLEQAGVRISSPLTPKQTHIDAHGYPNVIISLPILPLQFARQRKDPSCWGLNTTRPRLNPVYVRLRLRVEKFLQFLPGVLTKSGASAATR